MDTTNQTNLKFDYLVEDPFYCKTFGQMARMTDEGHLMLEREEGEWFPAVYIREATDGGVMWIDIFYKEWFDYNCQFSDFLNTTYAPKP